MCVKWERGRGRDRGEEQGERQWAGGSVRLVPGGGEHVGKLG